MTSSHISTSAAIGSGASKKRPAAMSIDELRALSPSERAARQAAIDACSRPRPQREEQKPADEYIRKAQAMRTLTETLVERTRIFDYAHLAVELANAHTSTLQAAPGLSDDNDAQTLGAVTDADGDPFEVGYHYFPDAKPGDPVNTVILGEHSTPIPVNQIPELIRLLLTAASGACNHPIISDDKPITR